MPAGPRSATPDAVVRAAVHWHASRPSRARRAAAAPTAPLWARQALARTHDDDGHDSHHDGQHPGVAQHGLPQGKHAGGSSRRSRCEPAGRGAPRFHRPPLAGRQRVRVTWSGRAGRRSGGGATVCFSSASARCTAGGRDRICQSRLQAGLAGGGGAGRRRPGAGGRGQCRGGRTHVFNQFH